MSLRKRSLRVLGAPKQNSSTCACAGGVANVLPLEDEFVLMGCAVPGFLILSTKPGFSHE